MAEGIQDVLTNCSFPDFQVSDLQKNNYNFNEDYCCICQKHFCNKYYLKKHKLDVHKTNLEEISENRLIFDSSTTTLNRVPVSLNSKVAQSLSINGDYFNQIFNQMSSKLFRKNNPSLVNVSHFLNRVEIPNIQQQFQDTFSIFNKSQFYFDNPETKSVLGIGFPRIVNTLQICYMCNIRFPDLITLSNHYNTTHCPSSVAYDKKLPIQNIPLLAELPSKSINDIIAVTNLDAFKYSMAAAKLADRVTCDICGKDLCNKYFLRTHRKKVHGIKYDEMEHTNFFNQLSKISDNTIAIKDTDTAIKNENKFELPFKVTSDIENDIDKHSKPSISTVGGSFNYKQYTFDQKKCKWIRKISTCKVKCNICDRLICNKYFLKTHKYKKHGIKEDFSLSNKYSITTQKRSSAFRINPNNLSSCDINQNFCSDNLTSYESKRILLNNTLDQKKILITDKLNDEPLDLSIQKIKKETSSDQIFMPKNPSILKLGSNKGKLKKLKFKRNNEYYKKLKYKYLGLQYK